MASPGVQNPLQTSRLMFKCGVGPPQLLVLVNRGGGGMVPFSPLPDGTSYGLPSEAPLIFSFHRPTWGEGVLIGLFVPAFPIKKILINWSFAQKRWTDPLNFSWKAMWKIIKRKNFTKKYNLQRNINFLNLSEVRYLNLIAKRNYVCKEHPSPHSCSTKH